MIGLLIKDLFNLRKDLKIYALFIAFYVAITLTSGNTSILMATIAIICIMMPLSAITHDEKVNWDKYSLTMPVSKNEIVLSKYIIGIVVATIGLIITTILSIIDKGLFNSYLELPFAFWSISMIVLSILLPIFFKFGAEKGRVIMVSIMILPTVISMLFSKLGIGDNITDILNKLTDYIAVISIVSVVISLTISITISIKIYNDREF